MPKTISLSEAQRKFVIGIVGRDTEGEYRPEFVERILVASREQSVDGFVDQESFLAKLR